MKTISLFQGILMGVFALAILVGVFVFATHTSKTVNSGNSVGAIVIWGTLPKQDMQNALTTIEQMDITLKDVSYVQKDESTLPAELASAIAVGKGPDLVLASQEDLAALAPLIAPIPVATLPTATFQSAFVDEGNLFATPDGKGYYGLPLLVDPLVLYSNTAILASDGIAKPPSSWEALTGLVPTVAVLTPTKQITRGLIALGTYDNVHDARAILSSLFLQVGVPLSSYQSGSLSANLTGNASSTGSPGQAVLDFYTQFADPSKVSYTWNASLSDSQKQFLAGDTALYLGFASEARFLKAANPNLLFKVTALPEPGTALVKNVYGLAYAFMITRGSSNAGGAYTAAATLTGALDQQTIAATTGLAPASLSALGTAPADPAAVVAYAEALYAHGWLSPAPADTDTVFSSMITGVISGRLTSGSALSAGASALTALLQK